VFHSKVFWLGTCRREHPTSRFVPAFRYASWFHDSALDRHPRLSPEPVGQHDGRTHCRGSKLYVSSLNEPRRAGPATIPLSRLPPWARALGRNGLRRPGNEEPDSRVAKTRQVQNVCLISSPMIG
jgi:hypothetical protein